ncbi:putative phage tail component-like protein [Alkalicoccobacillus murimartini]|uniref:Phage tail component-like protein n=2 Tax=Alkalicoccobacillus murimartini TaxID=171685 RepID=A0ABT9YG28_9BACI|nr:putative phage tail component-like protein [Alkalicoccobacillus murimartini]
MNMELFRPPTPPIEFITFDQQTDGERVLRKHFSGMELAVPITIRSDKRIEGLKQDLSEWLVHSEPKKLQFIDMPNMYYLAFYQSMELDERINFAKGVLTFYLPEAYRFGQTRVLQIDSSNKTHMVLGQKETHWKSKTIFRQETTNYSIELLSGKQITLHYTFGVGDTLEIDSRLRKIVLNGVVRMPLLSLASEWFKVQPGENQISSSYNTEVTYTEKFY